MSVAHAVLPTLAVLLVWLCVGLVLAGCGWSLRHLLLAPSASGPAGLAGADLWLGLAALIAYLLVWNQFLPVAWYAWALPVAVGLPATLAAGRVTRRRPWRRLSPVVAAGVLVVVVWLANASLGPAGDFDFGLYHLDLIAYAERYAAVPGLANLHARLGAADGHLLFAALLDHGPLSGAGPHLVNGLLASILIVDLASRFAVRAPAPRPWSFSRNLAILLVPATVAAAGFQITHRISSPNLDFSTFVLVAAGALYLAEFAERHDALAGLVSVAALATASSTRPLYWGATAFALAVVGFSARRRPGVLPGGRRQLVAAAVLPTVLAVAWAARQAVLSGYPFLPLTIAAIPVDWRVPISVVEAQNRIDDAWARLAGISPSIVFASWNWLHWWWREQAENADVTVPGSFLAAALVALAAGAARRAGAAARGPLLVVVAPSLGTLIIWFFVAPDPRFAWAPIWLVPLALCAFALPALDRRPRLAAIAAAAAAAVGLTLVGDDDPIWLVPAALAAGAVAVVVAIAARRRALAAPIAQAAALAVALAGLGIAANDGAFHIVDASGRGALGVPRDTVPRLVAIDLHTGLRVYEPDRSDQCWGALLCTPALTSVDLRLRGSGVADGFTDTPAPPPTYVLASTRACLSSHRIPTLDRVDVIASTAPGGAFRAVIGGNFVTISFGLDEADATALVRGYRRMAFANVRSGLADVLRRYGNTVTLWHRHPDPSAVGLVLGCLR